MSVSDIEVVVADTNAARDLHYALRYQVFCLETGFEDASRYPDQQEKDEFDDRAIPFLVRCSRSGDWLATARLILSGDGSLPIERYCDVSRHTIPFDQMAELSRLLIVNEVRRRRSLINKRQQLGSGAAARAQYGRPQRLITARILRDLIRAMAAFGLDRGIPHAAFFITPALARILGRMQIDLTAIGGAVRHRGLRFPFISRATQVYNALTRITERDTGAVPQPYAMFSELPTTPTRRTLDEYAQREFGT
jgi:N-acyl amino acid synthase of PEP-CTERM/exosortase system